MSTEADGYRLEDLGSEHPIGAGLFVPFVVQRLDGGTGATEAPLRVTLSNIGAPGERQRTLRLAWSVGSTPPRPFGVSEHTVTEWAALGVACAVVARYAGLRVRAVTAQGDRFDYWVDDGEHEYGLEVSGTLTAEVATRHRAKVRQWRQNPYGVDGYVVVVGFATREVIFSFHRFDEGSP